MNKTNQRATTGNAKPKAENTVRVAAQAGKSKERKVAEFCMSPTVASTSTALLFAKGSFGALDLGDAIDVMEDKVGKVNAGDLSDVEATLTAQAVALDSVFNELARRAAANMGQHMAAAETYLRLAFKAQAQCRLTLETLADVKHPKSATFIKQANIANQQQVNNGAAAKSVPRTEKNLKHSNELLEAQHGERMDSRAKGTAGGNDPNLEAVGAIDRRQNGGRQSTQQPKR